MVVTNEQIKAWRKQIRRYRTDGVSLARISHMAFVLNVIKRKMVQGDLENIEVFRDLLLNLFIEYDPSNLKVDVRKFILAQRLKYQWRFKELAEKMKKIDQEHRGKSWVQDLWALYWVLRFALSDGEIQVADMIFPIWYQVAQKYVNE